MAFVTPVSTLSSRRSKPQEGDLKKRWQPKLSAPEDSILSLGSTGTLAYKDRTETVREEWLGSVSTRWRHKVESNDDILDRYVLAVRHPFSIFIFKQDGLNHLYTGVGLMITRTLRTMWESICLRRKSVASSRSFARLYHA